MRVQGTLFRTYPGRRGEDVNISRPKRSEIEFLRKALEGNGILFEVLSRGWELGIGNYYVGAGAVTQTVWNFLFGYPPAHGIKDIDFVYFDGSETPAEEAETAGRVLGFYSGTGTKIDVKNEANVHLWYGKRFGRDIPPYVSLEDAISTWVSTATSIGVRIEKDGEMKVFAPFGLEDLFGKVIRPNKVLVTKERYEEKSGRWLADWPGLKFIPW